MLRPGGPDRNGRSAEFGGTEDGRGQPLMEGNQSRSSLYALVAELACALFAC